MPTFFKPLFALFLCFFVVHCFAQKTDFAVEVGAFAEKVPLSHFKISGVYETYDVNQIYRYYIDAPTRPEAEALRQKAITAGHQYARVIDFNALRQQCDAQCSYEPPSRTSNKTSGTPTNTNTSQTTTTSDNNNSTAYSNPEPVGKEKKPLRIDHADMFTFWKKEIEKSGLGLDSAGIFAFWKKEKNRIGMDSASWFRLFEQELYNPYKNEKLVPTNLSESERVQCIFFDFASAALRDESKKEMDKLVTILKKNSDWRLEIAAHTDSKGSVESNKRLSMRRANAAKKYIQNNGIAGKRVSTHYYGKSRPIARNTTSDGADSPEGRQLNRRVEFYVFNKENGKMDIVSLIFVPKELRLE